LLQAPVVVVPHDWPVVVRVQPVVSFSMAVVEPQAALWHTGSVRVRVRVPLSEHAPAQVHAPYAPYVDAPQLRFSVVRAQPAVSVSVFCTALQAPLAQSGSVRVRVREPVVLHELA
jgi:hypothetical protein